MKNKSNKIIKACLVAILAALGFTACSKPDDDPVSHDPILPGADAYGTMPASYQESMTTDFFD